MNIKEYQSAKKILKLPNFYYAINPEKILQKISNIDRVVFVSCFGSALNSPTLIEKTIGKWIFKRKIKETRYTAKDVDLLIVLNDDVCKKIKIDLPVITGDDYGELFISYLADKCHLSIISFKDIKKAIKNKDEVIIRILQSSIFVEGFEEIYKKIQNEIKNIYVSKYKKIIKKLDFGVKNMVYYK
jgi:hypothetical protein